MGSLADLILAGMAGGLAVFSLLAVPLLFWLHRLSVQMQAQSKEVEHMRRTMDQITRVMMEVRHGR